MKTFNLKSNSFWKYKIQTAMLCFFGVFIFSGCKKFAEVPAPATSINAANVYSADITAIGALNLIYTQSNTDLFVNNGLLADELVVFGEPTSGDYPLYYKNALKSNTSANPWERLYFKIFVLNSAIEGVDRSGSLTPAVKKQLLGEAKFMRAFYYFYLVNLYGDVPLVLTTDPEVNRLITRSPKANVYAQIEKDLAEAQGQLSKDFLGANLQSTTSERVRPTYWAATALFARTYLYQGKYEEAIRQANLVINNTGMFSLETLSNTFLKNSTETIWAIQPAPQGPPYNTPEGSLFVLPDSGPVTNLYNFYLSNNLVNAFEPGDGRKMNWISSVTVGTNTYPYAYKYKAGNDQTFVTEYEIVLRLAELYLIRAESYARLGNIAAAVGDVNVIRTRARAAATNAVPDPLPNLSANLNQPQLYAAIEHERQVELFTEFGHRWFDLKRTPGFSNSPSTRADEIMPAVTAMKGGQWDPNWKLLPIPLSQITQDPNMTNQQNPGY